MKLRKHLCRVLGHRYRAIWFKPPYLHLGMGGQAGVADTEAGCVYCGTSSPNTHFMNVADIDWTMTKHRKNPPRNGTYEQKEGP